MTRARLIERVIADYLANEGEFDTVDAGWAEASGDVQMNYHGLAEELDREFDRIARETARP